MRINSGIKPYKDNYEIKLFPKSWLTDTLKEVSFHYSF